MFGDHPTPRITFELFFQGRIKKEVIMKRQIEIFTAGCPLCDPVVKMVKELTCDQCDIQIYDLVKQCEDKTCLGKLEDYHVKKIPAVAVNGKLLSCREDQEITREELIRSGVGQG